MGRLQDAAQELELDGSAVISQPKVAELEEAGQASTQVVAVKSPKCAW